ncbi:MAG: sulfatase [Cyclobacteriaceae bacterium]|nr:sulfatase [Cyclobacteriaceae bacterium]
MRTITLLLLSLIFVFAACQPQIKKPNVLLIVADDLGYSDLGVYGSSFYETPVLDALSADGILFTDGYATCPVCSPSRSSIQTGKYPIKTGVTDWIPGRSQFAGTTKTDRWINLPTKNNMDLEEITLAEVLRNNGYNTFFAGKWHLGETAEYWPENQGYDINIGGHSKGSPTMNKENGANGYFSPYGNPRLSDGPEGEYLPDRLAAETISFIESQTSAKPFMICLPFYLVHNPQQAKEEMIDYFTKKRVTMNLDEAAEINPTPNWAEFATVGNYQERMVQGSPVYASMVKSLDENIGKIIEKLKDKDWYDNTLILFTSDNGGLSTAEGWPTSNLPFRAGKGWLYEGGIRVPLIVKMPGNEYKGVTNAIPVSGIDILPTILSAAGINSHELKDIDGVSIEQYFETSENNTRALYWHYPHYANQGGNPGSAIRQGKYKLIHDFERGTAELFDLEADPGELNDLSQTHEAIADSLFKLLDEWRIANNAAMMTDPNPNWDGSEPVVR